MSVYFLNKISEQFCLTAQERGLLLKTIGELRRDERRFFFQRLKSREREFKHFLKEKYALANEDERVKWVEITGRSLLEKGGEPDLVDSMVMDITGRMKVYRFLREKSEEEGIRLKAMVNFSGLSMVLFLVMVITALILYFTGR